MASSLALRLMDEFAVATGVRGKSPPRRYLWTDAFAVCNALGLWRRTGDDRYRQLAIDLVHQVHHVLGRHRPEDSRTGWISGLSDEEGERRPTAGGLRIGKPLNERGPRDPPDSRLEWEQDGQYFHYLTKWMHALSRMSREMSDPRYWQWAAELAVVSHRAFTATSSPGGFKRMVWKMSIDLTRPLVASMGQHDPLDGLVAALELEAARPQDGNPRAKLQPAIADLTEMTETSRLATDDPLGIGGLLEAATRLAFLVYVHHVPRRDLLGQVLIQAARSLRAFNAALLSRPANMRLAFRELGLSIGMSGIELIQDIVRPDRDLSDLAGTLQAFQSVARQIRDFWSEEEHRRNQTWREHGDINSVMLAASLVPEGFLNL